MILINVSWAASQHIRMISEGCGTEDWSNNAENSALITEIYYILKCIQIEKNLFFFQLYKYFTLPFFIH